MPDASASRTIDPAAKTAADLVAETERSLADLARRAEAAIQEGLAGLKARSRDYAGAAGENLDVAQKYVVDRVQERPVAATLTALGVGMLLGYLLAGRKS